MSRVPSAAPECGRLAAELSALRERTGLSLAALAGRTSYSKSSWQRYLNGTKPPPRQAVVALCALAREPTTRLLALWELADAAWSGRAVTGSAAPSGDPDTATRDPDTETPVPVPMAASVRSRRRRMRWLALLVVATVGVALTAVELARDGGVRKGSGREEWPTVQQATPQCMGAACIGRSAAEVYCGIGDFVKTLATFRGSGGQRLELRYGERCQAVWLRTTGLRVGEYADLSVEGGPVQRVEAHDSRAAYRSTDIAGPGDVTAARICVGGEGPEECFDWKPSP
ncbi:helix-turn-helix domain-containing protein [Streptomyces bluensis]|uniref:helix-turn-helix domain-containing protein n=1 Tax=Streptomyces bluensis TaxID=33897 RepID=UPI00331731E7